MLINGRQNCDIAPRLVLAGWNQNPNIPLPMLPMNDEVKKL
jgi:hypothetical protein